MPDEFSFTKEQVLELYEGGDYKPELHGHVFAPVPVERFYEDSGQSFTLYVNGSDAVDASVLISFLQRFLFVYSFCLVQSPEELQNLGLTDAESNERAVLNVRYKLSEYAKNKQALPLVHDVRIISISYNSPLVMALSGAIWALTIAAIISGGKIEVTMTGIKATLPSLGQGIRSLREALGKPRLPRPSPQKKLK